MNIRRHLEEMHQGMSESNSTGGKHNLKQSGSGITCFAFMSFAKFDFSVAFFQRLAFIINYSSSIVTTGVN